MYSFAVAKPDIKQVAFDQPTLAASMMNILNLNRGERVLAYDEAFLSSRDTQSRFNKDVVKLYSTIRGENCLHLWSTPSAQQIDKAMLFERIKAVFFIFTKTVNSPRLYACFSKEAIKRVYEKEGNVEHESLKKHMDKEAEFIGAFRDYNGSLRAEYDIKKSARSEAGITDFGNKYLAESGKTLSQVCKTLMADDKAVKTRINLGIEHGHLVEGRDYLYRGPRMVFLEPGELFIANSMRILPKALRKPPNSPFEAPKPIYARRKEKTNPEPGKPASGNVYQLQDSSLGSGETEPGSETI
jgi:hypothetical protein